VSKKERWMSFGSSKGFQHLASADVIGFRRCTVLVVVAGVLACGTVHRTQHPTYEHLRVLMNNLVDDHPGDAFDEFPGIVNLGGLHSIVPALPDGTNDWVLENADHLHLFWFENLCGLLYLRDSAGFQREQFLASGDLGGRHLIDSEPSSPSPGDLFMLIRTQGNELLSGEAAYRALLLAAGGDDQAVQDIGILNQTNDDRREEVYP
jgi:hypothetical protein